MLDVGIVNIAVNIQLGDFMKNGRASSSEEHAYHHGDLRRALIDAAMAMVREEQDWTFSLREVARRAGVSHNAPYNHFADKRELLGAIAAVGFETLQEQLQAAAAGTRSAEAALIKIGVAYVKFGVENPAHYRLMFGSIFLAGDKGRPEPLIAAAAKAKMVLAGIVYRGAQEGIFLASPKNKNDVDIAVLSAWSAVHGLTMLAIDGQVGPPPLKIDKIAEKLTRTFSYGLVRR
jgi:AcrR family transcriptional regulator